MSLPRRVLSVATVLLSCLAWSACDSITGASNIDYEITGINVARVSITYDSGSGTSQVASAALPWSYAFKADKDGFLYVSAQIIEGTGTITVRIRNDGDLVQSATATGFAAIATASGTNDK